MGDTITSTVSDAGQLLAAANAARRDADAAAAAASAERAAREAHKALDALWAWAGHSAELCSAAQTWADDTFGRGAATLELTSDRIALRCDEKSWDISLGRYLSVESTQARFAVTGPMRDLFADDVTVTASVTWLGGSSIFGSVEVSVLGVVPGPRRFFGRDRKVVERTTHTASNLAGFAQLVEEFGRVPTGT